MSRPWRKLLRDPAAWVGGGIFVLLVGAALLADIVAPRGPWDGDLSHRLLPPGSGHWFGTDHQGRDILARTLHGARISLAMGLGARTLSIVLGGLLGFLAGFRGGKTDFVIMRSADVFFAFPSLLLLVGITAAFDPGLPVVFASLGVVGWAEVARLVRSEVLSVRERPFIAAARALGLGEGRVLFRHVLPNCLNPLLISYSLGVAGTIMAEAGLSFLGLGAQPPTPSWGQMIQAGRDTLQSAPWVSFFPGCALAVTVLSLNLLGDTVRDAFDPRFSAVRSD